MSDQEKIEQSFDVRSETEKNLDEAAKVRYLGPDDFVLFRNKSGGLRLTLEDDKSFLRVIAKRCFPYAYPDRYISLRDPNGDEVGIVSDLKELSKEYQKWILEDLEMWYYTPRIKAINKLKNRFGGVEWYIETNHGPKKIITRGVHDTITEIELDRYMVTDVDGNRYELIQSELDDSSKAFLERIL